MLHEPTGNVHEIYRAMETAYKDGKLRAIGISNFMEERYFPKSYPSGYRRKSRQNSSSGCPEVFIAAGDYSYP